MSSRKDRRLRQAEGKTEGVHTSTPKAMALREKYKKKAREHREWLDSLPEDQRLAEEERQRERDRQNREVLRQQGGPGYPPGHGTRTNP